jgi:hypothetical protein
MLFRNKLDHQCIREYGPYRYSDVIRNPGTRILERRRETAFSIVVGCIGLPASDENIRSFKAKLRRSLAGRRSFRSRASAKQMQTRYKAKHQDYAENAIPHMPLLCLLLLV